MDLRADPWLLRGLGATGLFVAVTAFVLLAGTPTALDDTTRAFVRAHPVLDTIGSAITYWSLRIAQPLLVIALVVLLLRRQWVPPAVMVAVFTIADLLTVGLKSLFQRARPEEAFTTGFAYPSGHATGAAFQWGMLFLIALPLIMRHRGPAWWLTATWAAIALVTGLARVAEGDHWLTDVVAGLAWGAFLVSVTAWTGAVAARAVEDLHRRKANREPAQDL